MPLPTVLMTDVVRSAEQGDSHGGAYLINLEDKSFEQVLDWNRSDINWDGRGQGRGLRGICYVGDEIYIAASDELFVFDQSFNIKRSFRCDYLHHCHEICYDGKQYIYLSATSFDSILRFDTITGKFDKAWWIQTRTIEQGNQLFKDLRAKVYDPNKPHIAVKNDTLHINNVCYAGGMCLFSGLAMNVMMMIVDDQVKPFARVPATTHNCQPLGKGIVMNSTGQDAVVMADRNANTHKQFPYPQYDESTLTHTDIPGDYARQAFGRGLCVDPVNKLLIAGSSPGTVTAFDPREEKVVSTVQVTNDLRNAPHGLEIWPF